jgi:hypothetical protein
MRWNRVVADATLMALRQLALLRAWRRSGSRNRAIACTTVQASFQRRNAATRLSSSSSKAYLFGGDEVQQQQLKYKTKQI